MMMMMMMMISAPARFRMAPGDITWDDGHAEKREMVSKASVHYRDATGSKRCGNCVMYHANACDLVRGRIEPGDVCDRWEAKAAEKRFNPDELRNAKGQWSLSQSDFSGGYSGATSESVTDDAAKAVATRWNVSDEDLHALASEDGSDRPELSGQALKEHVAMSVLRGWHGSSGGPIPSAAIAHVSDKLGLDYQLSSRDASTRQYIKDRPAMDRAVSSLGDAIYNGTQEWLAQRGVSSVHVMRSTGLDDEVDDKRPFTSWTLNYGGLRHEPGRHVREIDVPASRVLSVPPTGFGTLAESEVVLLPAGKIEKQYSRIVQLNGQEAWVSLPPQEAPAAGGGAMMMPPVPGGVPGSTAGGEPPRWNGTEQSPRTGTVPEDADDAEWPTEGRTASPRPVAFPSTYMDGYWPRGQVQPQAGYQQPGGEMSVPPSTVRKNPKSKNKVRLSDLVKVGPEGYIHGYICVRPPCGHYEEAKFNSKAGAVEHAGQRVGRLRLNDDKSFSMTHIAADGTKTKLAGRFANRGDAAASAALYHNVTVLHREATGEAQVHLAAARDDLASGDHDGAIARLGEARAAAEKDGNGSLATHISGTQAALAEHVRPDNQPVVQPHPLGEVKPAEEAAPARTALQSALLAWQKTPDLARVGSAHGDVISDALNHPEVSGTTLYRGMNWDRLSSNPDDPKNLSRRARFENLKPGSMLMLPASSFSEDKQTAKDFSSGGTGVRLEVAPGSKGVNVAKVLRGTEAEQGNASEEAEWIAGGKYRVDGVSAGKDGRLVIQVSQVHDLSQPGASSEDVSEPVKPSSPEGGTPSPPATSAATVPLPITPEMTAPAASPGSPGTSSSPIKATTKPESAQAPDWKRAGKITPGSLNITDKPGPIIDKDSGVVVGHVTHTGNPGSPFSVTHADGKVVYTGDHAKYGTGNLMHYHNNAVSGGTPEAGSPQAKLPVTSSAKAPSPVLGTTAEPGVMPGNQQLAAKFAALNPDTGLAGAECHDVAMGSFQWASRHGFANPVIHSRGNHTWVSAEDANGQRMVIDPVAKAQGIGESYIAAADDTAAARTQQKHTSYSSLDYYVAAEGHKVNAEWNTSPSEAGNQLADELDSELGISGGARLAKPAKPQQQAGPDITAPRGPDISPAALDDVAKAGNNQYALHQAAQKHGLDASGLLRAQHLALNQKSRQALADENHMSLGKLDEALKANLQQLAGEGHVKARVTDETLGKILDSGHFKTQFETAKNAIGPNKTRAELEGAWFGYPHELNPRLRPIYGYIEPGGDRPVGIGSRRYTGYNADQLSSFGTTQVVLKDSVKPRSTITVGDSIQNKNESMASPLLDPEAHSFAAHPTHHSGPTSSPAMRGLDRDYGAASWRQNHFAEVQVHSADGKTRPVRTSDIDHVLFNDTPAKDLTDKLDAKGIPWRVFNAFTIAKDGTPEERQRALQVTREDLEYTRGRIARAQQKLQTASSWDKPKISQDLTRMANIQQSLESREKALTDSMAKPAEPPQVTSDAISAAVPSPQPSTAPVSKEPPAELLDLMDKLDQLDDEARALRKSGQNEAAYYKEREAGAIRYGDGSQIHPERGIPAVAKEHGITQHGLLKANMLHYNRQARRDLAAENGLSPEEGDAVMRQKLRDIASRRVATRVTNSGLEKILDDGAFKTQFETNASKALKSNETRAAYEGAWFGYPEDLAPHLRPVYGYVTDGPDRQVGIGSRDALDFTTDQLSSFGTTQVILKDSVKSRSTFNAGDSLTNKEGSMPSPMLDPDARSFGAYDEGGKHGGLNRAGMVGLHRDSAGQEFRRHTYNEVQVHSPDGTARPLTPADISHVLFDSAPPASLREKLDAKGIPWKVWNAAAIAKNGTPEEKARALQVNQEDLQSVREQRAWIHEKIANYQGKHPESYASYFDKDLKKIDRLEQKLTKDEAALMKAGVK